MIKEIEINGRKYTMYGFIKCKGNGDGYYLVFEVYEWGITSFWFNVEVPIMNTLGIDIEQEYKNVIKRLENYIKIKEETEKELENFGFNKLESPF